MDAIGPFPVFKFPPLVYTLGQMYLVCILHPWFLRIHCNINFVPQSLPFRFSDQKYVCIFPFPDPDIDGRMMI
jgi:hypothetical protein